MRNCAWKVIEPKRMVKLFSGIAHNSCSEDTALHTSQKRVVTVSTACVTTVMSPGTTKIMSKITVNNSRMMSGHWDSLVCYQVHRKSRVQLLQQPRPDCRSLKFWLQESRHRHAFQDMNFIPD